MESTPYPIATVWRQAEESRAIERDPLSHYQRLRHVWERLLHVMALQALGASTPPDGNQVPRSLLIKPTTGQWHELLQGLLPKPNTPARNAFLHRLGQIFWTPVPLDDTARLVRTVYHILDYSVPSLHKGVKLNLLFSVLVDLRNRDTHQRPLPSNDAKEIRDILLPLLRGLLSEPAMRDALRTVARSHGAGGERQVALDGADSLVEREESAGYWRDAVLYCGAEQDVDLRGLLVPEWCHRCKAHSLFLLDRLGEARRSTGRSKARYTCATCGASIRSARHAEDLWSRLPDGRRTGPVVRFDPARVAAAVDHPTRIQGQLFNPFLHTLYDVELDLKLPDDMDQVQATAPGSGPATAEPTSQIAEVLPRRATLFSVGVVPRKTGAYTLRPQVRWQRRLSRPGKRNSLVLLREEARLSALHMLVRRHWHVVGRDSQRKLMDAALKSALAGQGGSVMLEGETGTGATTLVDWFLRELPRGVPFLRTACVEADGRPSRPLVELVLKYARYELKLRRLRAFDEEDLLLHDGDLPGLVEAVADEGHLQLPAAPLASTEWQRTERLTLLAATFDRFLATISRLHHAVVLFVDDLQFAHPQTLEVLARVSSALPRSQVLLLTCTHSDQLDQKSPAADGIRQLSSRTSTVLPLGPLSREHVAKLIDHSFQPNEFTSAFKERIWKTTNGFPRHVTQILEALTENGVLARDELGRWLCTQPPHTIDVPAQMALDIERRLKRLPPAYLRVVKRAAVLGQRFPFDLLRGTLGAEGGRELSAREQSELRDTLEGLERVYHVITSVEHEHQFAHGRLQRVAYHQLTPPRRAALHLAVVEVLGQTPPSYWRDRALAYHAVRTGQADLALQHVLAVVERLYEHHHDEYAHDTVERACALVRDRLEIERMQRFELWIWTAEFRRRVGKFRDAIELLDTVFADARSWLGSLPPQSDHRIKIRAFMLRILQGKARAHGALGQLEQAATLLDQASEQARSLGVPAVECAVLARRSEVLFEAGDLQGARRCAEECRSIARQLGDRSARIYEAESLLMLSRVAGREGDVASAGHHAQAADEFCSRHDISGDRARVKLQIAAIFEEQGHLRRAHAAAAAAMETIEAEGDVSERAEMDLLLGRLLLRRGAVLEAQELIARAHTAWQSIGNPIKLAHCHLAFARCYLERDQHHHAEREADEALACYRTHGVDVGMLEAHAVRLASEARHVDHRTLQRSLDQAIAEAEPRRGAGGAAYLELLMVRASVLRRLDLTHEALRLLDEHEPAVDQSGSPWLQGQWSLERGCALHKAHRHGDALEAVRCAHRLFVNTGDAMLTSKTRTLEACVLARIGEDGAAEPLLLEQVAVCEEQKDPVGQAICLQELGRIAQGRGDHDLAERRFQESSALRGDIQDIEGIRLLDDLRADTE